MGDREKRDRDYDFVRKMLEERRGGKKPRHKADWKTAEEG
jgi:hypothetical protein